MLSYNPQRGATCNVQRALSAAVLREFSEQQEEKRQGVRWKQEAAASSQQDRVLRRSSEHGLQERGIVVALVRSATLPGERRFVCSLAI